MRFATTLSLFATTTFAVMAFAMSAVSAAAVELDEEGAATGTHCTTVTNNCTVHIAGTTTLQLPNMQVVSACTTEFVADFNENGSGIVRSVSFTGPSCISVNCFGAEGNWPIAAMQENISLVTTTMRFCLLGGSPPFPIHCHLPLRLFEHLLNRHHYEITIDFSGETQCPSGNWVTVDLEPELLHNSVLYDEVEIEHDV